MICSFAGRVPLAMVSLAFTAAAHAAVLVGHVVDSAGRPIAGAEVRVWQKVASANGTVADQQVMFDGREALVTNAEGRFATHDVLAGEAYAWVVVETEGMLAGRSGWIEIGKNAEVVAPEIAMKRLRGVIGQVLDRQKQPVAGATVFNSGDGHERVETKTGRGGKFFLDGVPEGAALLFAEKPGYRLTGMRLPAGGGETVLRLTSASEPDDPLATLPPLLSLDEETALAHQVLDPWLDETLKSGVLMRKLLPIGALQYLDPLAALTRFETLAPQELPQRAVSRHGLIVMAITCGQLSSDEARQIIESGDDPFMKAYEYLAAARHINREQRSGQVAWLDAALNQARLVADAAPRTQSLAAVAEGFIDVDEHQRAEQILAEAEKAADLLAAPAPRSADVIGRLALAWADSDPARATTWLEKIGDFATYQRDRAQLVLKLLSHRPEEAAAVWRATERRPAGEHPAYYFRYDDVADLCHRMAAVDLSCANEIAAAAETAALRIRGRAAITLAMSEVQTDQARTRLRALVRDDLPRLAAEEPPSRFSSPAITAAWLLPIAERVDPDLCRELFWRSLALRSRRPRRSHLDFEIETADALLSQMLARYDRDAAGALLEALESSVAQAARAAARELRERQTLPVARSASQWIRDFSAAAACVYPHRARELLAVLPDSGDKALINMRDTARQAFVGALAQRVAARWWKESGARGTFWWPRETK